MQVKAIRTEADYLEALRQVSELIDLAPDRDSPEGERLEVIGMLAHAYAAQHHPSDPPDPIGAIRFRMDPSGMGMKARIGVDADSGPMLRGPAGSVNDLINANSLLHGEETKAWGDARGQGAAKRSAAQDSVHRSIAMRPGKRRARDKDNVIDALIDKVEKLKAGKLPHLKGLQ